MERGGDRKPLVENIKSRLLTEGGKSIANKVDLSSISAGFALPWVRPDIIFISRRSSFHSSLTGNGSDVQLSERCSPWHLGGNHPKFTKTPTRINLIRISERGSQKRSLDDSDAPTGLRNTHDLRTWGMYERETT